MTTPSMPTTRTRRIDLLPRHLRPRRGAGSLGVLDHRPGATGEHRSGQYRRTSAPLVRTRQTVTVPRWQMANVIAGRDPDRRGPRGIHATPRIPWTVPIRRGRVKEGSRTGLVGS